MADAESDQGFHVRDRRRGGAESEPEPAPAINQGPATRTPAEPPGPEEAGHVPEPPQGDERSLVGLFAMLASLAAAALEGMPDSATGHARRDPGQAAEIIDLLLLLREKTEGRRTLEESQALDELLYELQLGYMRATTRR